MSAGLGESHRPRRLPRRPPLRPGQALDSYLEQLADANYLRPADLSRILADSTDTTRYLMLAPTEQTFQVLGALTGLTPDQVRGATLTHYDDTALDLTGLDPHWQASYRTVAARGRLPHQGSQICPRCLEATNTWQLAWRLPTTTVCPAHGTYLLSACPTCDKPFRATRHSLLRPVGAAPICSNARGARAQHCRTDLTTLAAPEADKTCIFRQERYDAALEEG